MLLGAWLKKAGVSISKLSRITGLAYTTTHAAVHNGRRTQFETAQTISAATGGEVSVNEICDPGGQHAHGRGVAHAR